MFALFIVNDGEGMVYRSMESVIIYHFMYLSQCELVVSQSPFCADLYYPGLLAISLHTSFFFYAFI